MIKFPLTCITNAQRQAWCQVAQILLQEEHNIMGKWYKITEPLIPETEHQKLRAEVQITFPYDGKKLKKENWVKYQEDRFNKKSSLISEGIALYKKNIMENKTYSVNLDDDVV